MTKRERLQSYLQSGSSDGFVPAAFFLHFGEGFKLGPAAIAKHQEFFKFTGMDFVKIQFELDFPKFEINSAQDFERIPSLPVVFYLPQFEVVKGLVNLLKSEALVVLTLYSPFMLVNRMAGPENVIKYLEQEPDPVFKALERVTESLSDFVQECHKLGLDGFYHSTQGGEKGRFKNPETFAKWIKPTDHRIMNEINERFSFNILHVCDYHQEYGGYESLDPFLDYPGQVVNVSTEIGGKHLTPAEISKAFGRPYMGGLDRLGVLATGKEDQVTEAAKDVLKDAPPKLILGADCTVPGDTPWSNLRDAISTAHASC